MPFRLPQSLRPVTLSSLKQTRTTLPIQTRTLATNRETSGWSGRHGDEHATNRGDGLDVQSSASKSGKQQRSVDSEQSGATSEKDTGDNNKRAEEDHPEAPQPVIGMNDERGPVSLFCFHLGHGCMLIVFDV